MEVKEKVSVPSGFDLLMERIATGQSYVKMAEKYKCSDVNIIKKIQRVISKVNPELQEQYLTKPNEAIRLVESMMLSELSNPDKIEKANLVQLSTAFGTIYDKRRLEEGKSTENVDFRALLAMESDIRSKLPPVNNPDSNPED